jgi:hypothetical protein
MCHLLPAKAIAAGYVRRGRARAEEEEEEAMN